MALIFDRFESVDDAAAFAIAVKEKHGRESSIYTSGGDAAEAGYFPFALEGAAAVLVDRETYDGEEAIISLVRTYGGSFAGT